MQRRGGGAGGGCEVDRSQNLALPKGLLLRTAVVCAVSGLAAAPSQREMSMFVFVVVRVRAVWIHQGSGERFEAELHIYEKVHRKKSIVEGDM